MSGTTALALVDRLWRRLTDPAPVETRPITPEDLLTARVDGHLPRHADTSQCGTCGHLAVLTAEGWTHYAVTDAHPVVPRCHCNGRTCPDCTRKVLATLHQEGYRPVHVDKLTRGWR